MSTDTPNTPRSNKRPHSADVTSACQKCMRLEELCIFNANSRTNLVVQKDLAESRLSYAKDVLVELRTRARESQDAGLIDLTLQQLDAAPLRTTITAEAQALKLANQTVATRPDSGLNLLCSTFPRFRVDQDTQSANQVLKSSEAAVEASAHTPDPRLRSIDAGQQWSLRPQFPSKAAHFAVNDPTAAPTPCPPAPATSQKGWPSPTTRAGLPELSFDEWDVVLNEARSLPLFDSELSSQVDEHMHLG